MASTLGSRPLNPVVEPPAPEPEPEPTPEQAAETAQFEAELDGHLAHLKSLDPASEHFSQDMLDALDLVDHHVGHSAPRIAELRDGVKRSIAAKARDDLAEHMDWAVRTIPPGADRQRALLHGFSLHLDNLDPDVDAETIAFGRQALGLDMKTPDSDEL
jgi:hypothetical protein